jgi:ubiquinone/menaquinone biosynthesis C-methylase UbiE
MRLLPRHGQALDIACGTGQNAFRLATAGLDVLGFDLSSVAIDLARAAASRNGNRARISFEVADAIEFLPTLPAATYAVVLSINYFEPSILADIKRVLVPGGVVVVQAFTENDGKMKESHIQDKLISETSLFEPAAFGGYWILIHEVDRFIDGKGLRRERVNMVARKPLAADDG